MPSTSPPPLPPTFPQKPAPQRSRHVWWKVVLLLFVVTGIVALVWWSRDEPPPDVSDFIFEPLQLPEDQNTYALITRAALLVPERKWTSKEDETLDAMIRGETWDDAIAQACLADISPALPLLEQAVRIPNGQTPWLSRLADVIPEVSPLRRLNKLLQITAHAKARAGNPDEALRTAHLALAVGHKIAESHGTLIHYLIGIANMTPSLRTFHEIVIKHTPSEEALRETKHAVSQMRPGTQSLAQAFYSELRLFEDGLHLIQQGGTKDLPPRIPLLLKPNKTRRIYCEIIRNSVAAIDLPLLSQQSLIDSEEAFKNYIRRSYVTHPENAVGRIYLAIIVPTTTRILINRLRHQSEISATEALIAIHLYRSATGDLPASLEELVPAYLPAVPRDYFDGGSIRYSRELGVIWSVGEKNLNITEPDQPIDKRDVVIYLTPRPKQEASAQ